MISKYKSAIELYIYISIRKLENTSMFNVVKKKILNRIKYNMYVMTFLIVRYNRTKQNFIRSILIHKNWISDKLIFF